RRSRLDHRPRPRGRRRRRAHRVPGPARKSRRRPRPYLQGARRISRATALMLMLAAPVLWSTAGVVTRHVERATPFELVFWRSLFAFAFVAAALLILRRSPLKMGRPGLVSGALWGVMFTAFMIALTFTSTANTLVVMSISPFVTTLLARAFLSVFQLGLPCMLMVVAARVLLAPEIALIGLLEVVLGPLWAWLGAGEIPARATVSGGAIVLAALIINELATFRRIMTSKLSVTRTSG